MTDGPDEYLLLLLAMIDGQQRAVDSLRSVAARHEDVQATLTRLIGVNVPTHDAVEGLKLTSEATSHRLDEIETQIYRGFFEVGELQTDLFMQQSQTLNAFDIAFDGTG